MAVALGQAGDLDIVDVVARIAQAVEQRGLAGAGRGDQRRGHAGIDGGQQAGERLVEEWQAEVVVGGDLARERNGMKAERGAQVGGFGSGDRGRLGHRNLPLVMDERVGICGKPPSGPSGLRRGVPAADRPTTPG
jgi:hypothetical protein